MATIKDKLNTINTTLDNLKTNFNLEENASIEDISSAAVQENSFVITKWTEDGYAEEIKFLNPNFYFNWMPFVGEDHETSNGSALGGKVKKVILPEGMTSANFREGGYGYHFAYMPDLIEIDIPTTLTTFPYGFIYHCPKFKMTSIPDHVTVLKGRSVRGTASTQISMRNVSSIYTSHFGDGTFMMSEKLCALWIGSAITTIDNWLAYECPKIRWIFIDKPRAEVETYPGYPTKFSAQAYGALPNNYDNIQIICNDDPEWLTKEEFDAIDWEGRLNNE